MSDSEIEKNLEYASDQDVSKHHTKLVDAVEQLDKGRKVKKAVRSEPSIQVSEYHLVKSGVTDKDTVRIEDLVKSLGRKGDQNSISKKLRYIQQKNKVLPKPLEKPTAERIKRTIGYDSVKKELSKWNGIIARNRTSDRLSFPIERTAKVKNFNSSNIPEFLKGFRTKSDLMKKFEEVDPSLLYPSVEEEKKDDEHKSTMKEIISKRRIAAKLRAQQSYQEAKARRQRKIKSKKFHRIQRKDKIKQQLKEFEQLQCTNPEEALAKLEQLDKTRAEERMSLRHKNTGQWAKNKQIKAKYNKDIRQELANSLVISRELTQKLQRIDSDDDSEEEKEEEEEAEILKKENNEVKTESEIDDFIKNYRKYWDEKNQKEEDKKIEISNKIISEKEKVTQKMNRKVKNVQQKNNTSQENASNTKGNDASNAKSKNASDAKIENSCDTVIATTVWQIEDYNNETVEESNNENKLCDKKNKSKNIDELFYSMEEKLKHKVDLKLQKVKKKFKLKSDEKKQEEEKKEDEDDLLNLEFENSKQKPILDCPLEETTSKENVQANKNLMSLKTIVNTEQESTSNNHEVEIDPKKYSAAKPEYLKTQMPDVAIDEEENSEDEEKMDKIMDEAFADNGVEEFKKEQKEEMEKSQPKTIDLSLHGWGNWMGPNIKKSKIRRKKKKFILNMPKETPRRPENQGKVIIFHDDDKKLRKHQVRELPYPFTRVKDYEANIRAPISRTFVPMNAHLKMIQPTVNTKLGQVIEPMDEDVLVKKPMLKKTLKRRIDKKKDNRKNTAKNIKKRRKSNVTA